MMAPLVVMLAAGLVSRVLGAMGLLEAGMSWIGALRLGLAVMFFFTAGAHFARHTRQEMIRMVPPQLPQPALLVTLTGLLELAGAVGLLLPPFIGTAAYCLIALLAALFPANVHAARAGLTVGGRVAMPLRLRLPLQLFWIGAL